MDGFITGAASGGYPYTRDDADRNADRDYSNPTRFRNGSGFSRFTIIYYIVVVGDSEYGKLQWGYSSESTTISLEVYHLSIFAGVALQ